MMPTALLVMRKAYCHVASGSRIKFQVRRSSGVFVATAFSFFMARLVNFKNGQSGNFGTEGNPSESNTRGSCGRSGAHM